MALGDSDTVLASRTLSDGKSHASHLTILIGELLKECQKTLSDLNAVAVSKGPGSYTGLRIGVSTAKGLCYALDKPLISVNTLQSMANSPFEELDPAMLLCPMLDARRMEVYCAMYDLKLEEKLQVAAVIVDGDTFEDVLEKNNVLFFGDGAEKCKSVFKNKESAHFNSEYQISANTMASISNSKFQLGEFEDVAYFEPFYLKDFVAGPPKKMP